MPSCQAGRRGRKRKESLPQECRFANARAAEEENIDGWYRPVVIPNHFGHE